MIKTASNEISKVMIKNDLIILRSTVSVSTSRNINEANIIRHQIKILS